LLNVKWYILKNHFMLPETVTVTSLTDLTHSDGYCHRLDLPQMIGRGSYVTVIRKCSIWVLYCQENY